MMDTEALKKEVRPHLEAAIEANGGIERVRKIYGMMTGVIDFVAGWTAARIVQSRLSHENKLTHEEIRRVYDLVRLRLDSESSTS